MNYLSRRGILEITNGPFEGLFIFFENLQTLPDGLSRALLLVEILGSVQRLQIQLPQLKKLGLLKNKRLKVKKH